MPKKKQKARMVDVSQEDKPLGAMRFKGEPRSISAHKLRIAELEVQLQASHDQRERERLQVSHDACIVNEAHRCEKERLENQINTASINFNYLTAELELTRKANVEEVAAHQAVIATLLGRLRFKGRPPVKFVNENGDDASATVQISQLANRMIENVNAGYQSSNGKSPVGREQLGDGPWELTKTCMGPAFVKKGL